MAAPLHILVVDDRPDGVLFLTEFLLSRQHRVEISSNGNEALEAVVRRHRAGDAYELVISDVSMPGMDGLTLLKELRRRQSNVFVALYTAYGSLHPNLHQQATHYGALAVLDKPLELRRIEILIDDVATRLRKPGTESHAKDQPFFGTSRVVRPPTASVRRDSAYDDQRVQTQGPHTSALERKPSPLPMPVAESTNPPAVALPVLPVLPVEQGRPTRDGTTWDLPIISDADIRQPGTNRTLPVAMPPTGATSATPASSSEATGQRLQPDFGAPLAGLAAPRQPPLPPGTQTNSTSFTRRSTQPTLRNTGTVRRPSGLFMQESTNSFTQNPQSTSRVRRSISGTWAPTNNTPPDKSSNPPPAATPATASSRAVACAHCRKVFIVLSKPDIYTCVCVHCSGMNRIDPL